MNNTRYIYIAGLGHSGSTILDMSLGTLPGVMGVGELKTILDGHSREKHFTSLCSCGKQAKECPFWKDIPELLKGKLSEEERLEKFIAHFSSFNTKNTVLVDTSKNSYKYLSQINKTRDLKVIYLTRDIRSWSYARHLASRKPLLYFFVRWTFENYKLRYKFKKMGISLLNVGYEELALYPDLLLKKITAYCSLQYNEDMLFPERSKSHIISGNIARTDSKKLTKWIYDTRWMLSRRLLLYSPLLLCISSLNRKRVYSNISGASIKDFHLFGTKRREALSKKNN